jgi:type I thyroxine 5'-deiodinase
MAGLEDFAELVKEYKDRVDFVVVYIEEGHADDEWYLDGNIYHIKKHKTITERFAAADQFYKVMKERIGDIFPVLVDDMTDEANLKYAAVPDRLFIIKDGVVVPHSGKGPFGYNTFISNIRKNLDDALAQKI